MRTRVLSSLFVVLIGLVPLLYGGPVFAFLMISLGIGGFYEYAALTSRIGGRDDAPTRVIGWGVIAALGIAALLSANAEALFTILIIAVATPLISRMSYAGEPGALTAWSLASSGALYLGLPVYAAISLRSFDGVGGSDWLFSLATFFTTGWNSAPLGLAWTLTAVVATWVGDSAAYLVGRQLGKRKLAPAISPGKTVEGSIGGIIASAAVGGAAFAALGIGQSLSGLIVGAILGLVGQLGDLSESFMKRQAAVKDSGALIPGHGGILDRIDALLFVFPAAFLLASGLERLGAK